MVPRTRTFSSMIFARMSWGVYIPAETVNPDRSALHAAVVRGDLEVAALLLVNPGLSGLELDDLCDQDE